MNSICDHAKKCPMFDECDQAKEHDCGDYSCCIGGKFTCDIYPLAKCVPIETIATAQKPKGSRSVVMKDIIDENVQLKIKLHELELSIATWQKEVGRLNAENAGLTAWKNESVFKRIVWAVKGGAV